MEKLNKKATEIFCQIIKTLDSEGCSKLNSEGYMPLSVEMIGEGIGTPYGDAKLYSFAHYYEQNGDLMRDPEMVFIVVDNRAHEDQIEMVGIYPQNFRIDASGVDQDCVDMEDGRLTAFCQKWQKGQCDFANVWLVNLMKQGFLK